MKIFEGLVVSISDTRSASVEITRRTPHALYKKLIKKSKKFSVDTTGFELKAGDRVKIVETKPISKTKFFKVSEVLSVSKAEVKKTEEVEEKKSDVKIEKTKVEKKKAVKGKTK